MKRYLLDTNILSYLEDHSSLESANIRQRMGQLADDDELAVSVLSLYEYETGIIFAPEALKPKLRQWADDVLTSFPIVGLDVSGTAIYSALQRAFMRHHGIGKYSAIQKYNFDFMLAATAITHDFILVSNDRIFESLVSLEPGMVHENWAA